VSHSTRARNKASARGHGLARAACFACTARLTAVTPIRVPEQISSHTQLELSGIVWSDALSRYARAAKGHRHRSRRRLLQLALEPGRAARVDRGGAPPLWTSWPLTRNAAP